MKGEQDSMILLRGETRSAGRVVSPSLHRAPRPGPCLPLPKDQQAQGTLDRAPK